MVTMISVVLIQPENSGNIGAVARAMKNFGVNNLVVIKPKVKVNTITSMKRSKHASDIIKKAKIKDFDYLKRFDYLIATTGKLGTDYNIPRSPVTPEELSLMLKKRLMKTKKVGLVFGRESKGLFNEEIAMCDFVVSIPTSKKYFSMNLSHAVSTILYELYKKSDSEKITDNFIHASKKEKDLVIKNINKVIDNTSFSTEHKRNTQKTVWKKIIGKAFLTKRESFALIGFFKKLIK